ncbi:MAG: hypothetical protein UY23_C0001G0179 [Candidatus Jorgensenbacteria bacterium GW2011_GWA1_48_11]|uniref:Uncharacterized protein n=1 Tax=Candidatus Jorgensenbacteria bacterium GW2011_GWA1_48_11 TaxID=1618660 RepID=A0A0G1WML9_9BACT|nr:MAG: hypothetical protein UY23_C0001G0179 [Candidatus Jorgensenbacteria bacterium GW2011_GWA1_48_11]
METGLEACVGNSHASEAGIDRDIGDRPAVAQDLGGIFDQNRVEIVSGRTYDFCKLPAKRGKSRRGCRGRPAGEIEAGAIVVAAV